MTEVDYKEILLNSIPKLKKCDNFSGCEGVAYMINDDFIVKQYKAISRWDIFGSVFDEFCKEMQKISNNTLYPKIYAWESIPNMNYYLGKESNKFDFYILEERVKGRDLYFGFLQDSYEIVKDICSSKEFYEAVFCPENYYELFREIINLYIKDYISINEMLESLNESEIEKFIADCFYLDSTTKFLNSDVHPTNIIIENNIIRPIDPMVAYIGKQKQTTAEIKDFFVCKLVNLFWANEMCNNESLSKYFKYDASLIGNDFQKLQLENMKVCKAAMLKFVKILNKVLDKPEVFDNSHINQILFTLDDIFLNDEKGKQEILQNLNINREF